MRQTTIWVATSQEMDDQIPDGGRHMAIGTLRRLTNELGEYSIKQNRVAVRTVHKHCSG